MPNDNVLILDRIVATDPFLHTMRALALIRELASSVEFAILVFGDPDGFARVLGSRVAIRIDTRKDHLTGHGHQLVRNRLVRDGVDDIVVANLEDPVTRNIGVGSTRVLDHRRLRNVADLVRVVLVLRHRYTVLVVHGILEPVNCRINAEGEQVLVEGCHHAGSDIRSVRDGLTILIVKRHGGQNTGGPHLELNVGCLVKDEGKDVLIIGDGTDHLQDELSVANDGGCTGAVVSVLVLQSTVLLMHADDVFEQNRIALGVGPETVKVFDMAETVAS